MADQFEAWITKYVLTQGMDRCVVETCGDDMVSVVGAKYRTLYHKPDWHRTEAEANERVRKMIAAKRKSIAKVTARLDELERRFAPAVPAPSSKEHDRARSEAMWDAAGGWIQECDERRDKAGAEDAAFDQQNYALALDIHRGAGREKAIAELRRRYDALAGYLMIYGGTDFVNGCRSAIAEERWCDLVESIAALEHEHVRGKRLRWGKDADGNRIAMEIEPGRYQIPADLYPGHPFDAINEKVTP